MKQRLRQAMRLMLSGLVLSGATAASASEVTCDATTPNGLIRHLTWDVSAGSATLENRFIGKATGRVTKLRTEANRAETRVNLRFDTSQETRGMDHLTAIDQLELMILYLPSSGDAKVMGAGYVMAGAERILSAVHSPEFMACRETP